MRLVMEIIINNKLPELLCALSSLILTFPMALAENNIKESSSNSTVTVVLLTLLLCVLCVLLILAWRKLIHIDGGEDYHPQVLWGKTQTLVQQTVNRLTQREEEERSIAEEERNSRDEEMPEMHELDPHITAL
ncbi:protein tyrosine phosphatase receptor type C-associated protein [Bombina bombina]|uniref:protein tyrosine phosphatase receptor type C-associated protein n=1 Tax=Bombina bombina TaxID=8345 RepID=UPI00235AA9A4|nr:protein tyrosine phosphatase receptor type C-associated protein [Bombina bombina]